MTFRIAEYRPPPPPGIFGKTEDSSFSAANLFACRIEVAHGEADSSSSSAILSRSPRVDFEDCPRHLACEMLGATSVSLASKFQAKATIEIGQ
jgi:hypothetical protein